MLMVISAGGHAMSEAMLLLHSEHSQMAKVLHALDEQIRAFDAKGEPLDHELLKKTAEYVSDYPEKCHHPKEDLVFRKMSHRDPAAAAGLRDLIDEHKELARLTERFESMVTTMPDEPTLPAEDLNNLIRYFVDYYFHHMNMEEKHFFPMALRVLSSDDWAEIEFAFFDRADPLFDDTADERFQTLRNEISRLADRRNKRTAKLSVLEKEVKQLHRIKTVNQFNEAMKDARTHVRMVRLPGGLSGSRSNSAWSRAWLNAAKTVRFGVPITS